MSDFEPRDTQITNGMRAFARGERLLSIAEEHCINSGLDTEDAALLLEQAEPGLLLMLETILLEQERNALNDQKKQKFAESVAHMYAETIKSVIDVYLNDKDACIVLRGVIQIQEITTRKWLVHHKNEAATEMVATYEQVYQQLMMVLAIINAALKDKHGITEIKQLNTTDNIKLIFTPLILDDLRKSPFFLRFFTLSS